jgi:glycosyltransferase 2 family protein
VQTLKRSSTRWLLGTLLGVVLVWWATQGWPMDLIFGHPVHLFGLSLLGGNLGGADPEAVIAGSALLPETAWQVYLPGLLPYIAALVIIHFLRAWRWAPLLRRLGHKVPFSVLNTTGGVSFAAIFLLPLRLGELVRPVLLSRHSELTVSEGMALVVLERIFDGLAVTLVLLGVLLMLPEGDPEAYARIRTGTLIALVLFGSALLFIIAAYVLRRQTDALLSATIGRIAPSIDRKVRAALANFHRGLDCLPDWRALALFWATTIVYWSINGIGHYAMVRAFGFPVDPVVGYAMMAAVAIGMMVPNAPANVGTFWYCVLLPLQIYGITGANVQASVFALTLWGLQMTQMTLFGCYFLARSPVSVRDVQEAVDAKTSEKVADVDGILAA